MAVLPPRPLLLDPEYVKRNTRKSLTRFALFLAVTGALGSFSIVVTRQVLDERALWERGTPAEVVSISGEVREKRKLGITFFYEYDLDVEYKDAQGSDHRGRSEFELVWSPLDHDVTTAAVRYDPQQPSHFALSSPVEAGLPRWGFPILGWLLAALMLYGLYENRRNHSRTLRWFEAVALDGEEFLLPLVSVTAEKAFYHVSFRLPGGEKSHTAYIEDPPLVLLDHGEKHVVVLRSPREPDGWVVLRRTLAPFRFDPAAVASVQALSVS